MIKPINGKASNENKHFQILSLDGGGIKGLFSAAILSHFEDDFGIKVLAAEKIRPKIAVVVLVLSQGSYPQPSRSGPSAEHGFGMAVGNRRRVLDGGDFFLKSILFVTF